LNRDKIRSDVNIKGQEFPALFILKTYNDVAAKAQPRTAMSLKKSIS
jgi:hypothetical protein